MKHIALMMALVVCASVVGYANYNKQRPGGATTIGKTHAAWTKDQARLPREGCVLGVRDWICE